MKAMACQKCWSVMVDELPSGKEKCRMCGHEQDPPKWRNKDAAEQQ